jgi:hypothetical protein
MRFAGHPADYYLSLAHNRVAVKESDNATGTTMRRIPAQSATKYAVNLTLDRIFAIKSRVLVAKSRKKCQKMEHFSHFFTL